MHATLGPWVQAAGKVAECMMSLKTVLEAADGDLERAEPEAAGCERVKHRVRMILLRSCLLRLQ